MPRLFNKLDESIFFIDGDETTLGRDVGNHICLADAGASRKHCQIQRRGVAFYLIDLGSRNGTMCNGMRIGAEHKLRYGDVIAIGETEFVFQEDPDELMDETARKMERGKGYATMMSEIVGDARRKDVKRARKLHDAGAKTNKIQAFLKKRGWKTGEVELITDEAKGKADAQIADGDVIEKTTPKANERRVRVSTDLGLKLSHIVQMEDRAWLVVGLDEAEAGTVWARLKAC